MRIAGGTIWFSEHDSEEEDEVPVDRGSFTNGTAVFEFVWNDGTEYGVRLGPNGKGAFNARTRKMRYDGEINGSIERDGDLLKGSGHWGPDVGADGWWGDWRAELELKD